MNAEDLNAIRDIVQNNRDLVIASVNNQIDAAQTTTRNQAAATQKALVDFMEAVAAVGGIDLAAVRTRLSPKTKAVLDSVD